ncbi:MAG: ATP-grasp domain-containing protein [Planctomycetaceae bacterium]
MSAESEKPDLLIAGASARACAFSVLRVGLRPSCFDQFADADLQEAASVERVERYPHDLPQMMARFEGVPWMYTGALENYPDVVAEISQRHSLFGNPPEVLHRVRDPFQTAQWLADAGFATVPLRPADDPPPADGTWLLKPLCGGAGIGIRVWDETALQTFTPGMKRNTSYFQKFLRGESYSALFAGDGTSARLLGITRQLVGRPEFRAARFAYCGSIGPVRWNGERWDYLQRLGQVLAEQGGLVGLFGCDLIVTENVNANAGEIVLIEVNPRYPASAEVLELATGCSTLVPHFRGCAAELFPLPSYDERQSTADNHRCVGKAILYAANDFVVKTSITAFDPIYRTLIADVPRTGESIQAGHPLCTAFVRGASLAQCEQFLCRRAPIIYESVFGQ